LYFFATAHKFVMVSETTLSSQISEFRSTRSTLVSDKIGLDIRIEKLYCSVNWYFCCIIWRNSIFYYVPTIVYRLWNKITKA
jgi:hypothetical protein